MDYLTKRSYILLIGPSTTTEYLSCVDYASFATNLIGNFGHLDNWFTDYVRHYNDTL